MKILTERPVHRMIYNIVVLENEIPLMEQFIKECTVPKLKPIGYTLNGVHAIVYLECEKFNDVALDLVHLGAHLMRNKIKEYQKS